MRLIDLSHPIAPSMPVYPGTEQPVFEQGNSIEVDGFAEKKITLYSHTGTHIDAPAHLLRDGNTLDQFPLDYFHGRAVTLSFEGLELEFIDVEDLKPFADQLEHADFLLIQTGWGWYWGTEQYFSDYPVLSPEAGEWLGTFNLNGIGIDAISTDRPDTPDYRIHKILLQNDILIIENLSNLQDLPKSEITFSCFPLNFVEADGSPVRAVATVE